VIELLLEKCLINLNISLKYENINASIKLIYYLVFSGMSANKPVRYKHYVTAILEATMNNY